MRIIAHRGLPVLYPENSFIGMVKAYEAGADELEMDIRVTKDNVLILMHDASTAKTTCVHKYVDESHWSELENLRLNHGDTCTTERIPTVEQIFAYFQDKKIRFLLDCKREVSLQKSRVPFLLVPLVKKYGLENRVRYASAWFSIFNDFKQLTNGKAITVGNVPLQDNIVAKIATKLLLKKGLKSEMVDDLSFPFNYPFTKELKQCLDAKRGKINVYSAFDCTHHIQNSNNEDAIVSLFPFVHHIITDDVIALKQLLQKQNQ